MAVIDDTFLSSLFQSAGDSFEVPADGAADIRQRALHGETAEPDEAPSPHDDDPVDESVTRRLVRVVRDHRVLSVAAVMVLVGAVTGAGLIAGRGTPSAPVRSASAPHASPGETTTTIPGHGPQSTATDGARASAGKSSNRSLAAPDAAGPLSAAAGGGTSGTSAGSAFGVGAPATSSTGTGTGTAAPNLPNGSVGQSTKVEQTGSLDLTVAKGTLTAAMAKLSYLATAAGGFVANSQTQSGASTGGPPSGTVTLQVPLDSFDSVLKGAQSLGKTAQLTTKATDVTGQYVDLQSRITALQDSRQQYLTIMAKATSIGDVLAVQTQLDSLQSQIEQLQGQLQVLTSETAYSTMTIALSEKGAVVHHHTARHPSSLQKAWHASIHGFTSGVDGLIRLAGPLLFALLCLAVLVLGGRVLWRRIQRHNL